MDPSSALQPLIEVILDLGLIEESVVVAQSERWLSEGGRDPRLFLSQLLEAGSISERQSRALSRVLPDSGGETVTTDADPVVGQRFGDYVAREKVGHGGMGAVYRASKQGEHNQDYVIKLFYGADDPEAVGRIAREGEIMASIRHPNVLHMFEQGSARGRPYLVLEFIDGPTLQELVEQRQRFGWQAATRAVEQVARALQVAHGAGIVHRDVKPHNLLVAPDGTIKLCDFGLAKAVQGDTMRSRAGQILGSPAYIAPEQWGDHEVDERADLFALGVVYYLLLTGVTPFRGRTAADLAIQIQAGDYHPVDNLSADVPASVKALVAQLLERDRRYRTPSAEQLLAELQRVLRGQLPDVPRLEPDDPTEATIPLVGRGEYRLGWGDGTTAILSLDGARTRHALLKRTSAGLLLSRAEPEAKVTINSQVAGDDDVVLKAGDVIGLGDHSRMTYREGNLVVSQSWDLSSSGTFPLPLPDEDTGALDPLVLEPCAVPGVLAAALEDMADPVAILLCIEALDSRGNDLKLRASRELLAAAGVEERTCEAAYHHARHLLGQRADWLADQLFHVTHENLGEDVDAWISWWLEARTRYDVQVRPPTDRVGGELIISSPDAGGPRRFAFDLGEDWTMGRSLKTEISVPHPSVSRQHARFFRLISRVAFRDLGSRLGIRQGGLRSEVGVLVPGVPIDLGQVRVEFVPSVEPRAPDVPGRPIEVDRATFTALVELRSPATVRCLINLLDAPRLRRVSANRSAKLGLPLDVDAALGPFLDAHRALALEGLPAITRQNFHDDISAWRTWWRANQANAPAQVSPRGWGV